MHPSSFYDLRARYVYTPLHGPYSLSEALEGLLYYSLDESWDSIAIGCKRTLWHELISELSNVVDDLQDYLLYFSSKFLTFPLNSLDFIKELRASHDEFKHLVVCWGAIIAHLVIARKIVEQYFWPHLFQPVLDNPPAFQRLGQLPSFVLPAATLNKSSASVSAFVSSSHANATPCSLCCSLESQHRLLNAQSEHPERPQSMPSDTNPTGGKEYYMLSSRLNTTPTLSGSCPTQVPWH